MRKAQYSLVNKLTSGRVAPALVFGSAIHKALEVWYSHPRDLRGQITKTCKDYQVEMLNLFDVNIELKDISHHACLNCDAIGGFLGVAHPLVALDDTDKRSLQNGIKILNNYFKTYRDDPYVVMSDPEGRPYTERELEMQVYEDDKMTIRFFGTIDVILKNEMTGTVLVCDHKTTTVLGNDFYNRVKPNFQYIGYSWAARETLGLETDLFMVNGLQVAKTVRGLARQTTTVTQDDITEFKRALVYNVGKFIECLEINTFPMNCPNPCTMYGGCQYRAICEVPESIKPNIIEGLYNMKGSED